MRLVAALDFERAQETRRIRRGIERIEQSRHGLHQPDQRTLFRTSFELGEFNQGGRGI